MKTKRYTGGRLLLLCLLFFPLSHFVSAQQVARSFTAPDGTFIGFYEFKPAGYNSNPAKKYPLIIFLHGIGERGDGTSELPYLTWQGIPKLISQGATMTFTNPNTREKESFMVLSPQLPKNKGAWENVYIDEMLKYAKANLQVDTNKIYLTGLSLGGGGVWSYTNTSVAHAKKFAAIAPICGVCYYNYGTLCTTIGSANIGVWGFTNADDNIVSPACTIQAVDALSVCNPSRIKKTVYPSGGHDSWTKAYDTGRAIQTDINLYEWFLVNAKAGVTPPPNQAPVAKAGNDVSITLPVNSVNLSGTGSTDNDGTITSYNWSKVSGPAQFNILTAGAAASTVNNLVEGIYVFKLTVTDNNGATASATVQVTVHPAPLPANVVPVANAGSAVTITLPVNSVTLNGGASYDTDGSIVSYSWSKISGPSQSTIASAASAATEVRDLAEGIYLFKLTVTDNRSATASANVQVTVRAAPVLPNQPPVANAGAAVSTVLPVNTVVLNGSASKDPDGNISSYLWTKTSGPAAFVIVNSQSASTTINGLVEGIYIFTLTVTDNHGATASANAQVTVQPAPSPVNTAPVANAGKAIAITLPVNSVTLDGSLSADADGSIVGYSWTKREGPVSFSIVSPLSASTVINNLTEGLYTFALTVTDNKGASSSATVQVTVSPRPNHPPVARAGADRILNQAAEIVLDGNSSSDPDGQIISYNWKQVSGLAGVTIVNDNSSKATVQGLIAGEYLFRLTVTDNDGSSATDEVKVSIVPAQNKRPKASAGKDTSISLPATSALLNGSGSSDPDGVISSYLWRQLAGPSSAVMANKAARISELGQLTEGEYVFMLTITDNGGLASMDTVNIMVMNPFKITQHFNLYPNPVKNQLQIRYIYDQQGPVLLTIFDMNGVPVKAVRVEKKSMMMDLQMDVSDLRVGHYNLQLQFADGSQVLKRFLKR